MKTADYFKNLKIIYNWIYAYNCDYCILLFELKYLCFNKGN